MTRTSLHPVTIGLLLLVGVAAPLLFPSYTNQIAVLWLMIVFASTWDILGGQMGYNSLGNIFFFGAGMYTCAVVQIGLYYDVGMYTSGARTTHIAFTTAQYFTGFAIGIVAAGVMAALLAVVPLLDDHRDLVGPWHCHGGASIQHDDSVRVCLCHTTDQLILLSRQLHIDPIVALGFPSVGQASNHNNHIGLPRKGNRLRHRVSRHRPHVPDPQVSPVVLSLPAEIHLDTNLLSCIQEHLSRLLLCVRPPGPIVDQQCAAQHQPALPDNS